MAPALSVQDKISFTINCHIRRHATGCQHPPLCHPGVIYMKITLLAKEMYEGGSKVNPPTRYRVSTSSIVSPGSNIHENNPVGQGDV